MSLWEVASAAPRNGASEWPYPERFRRLQAPDRDLDSNVIALPPGDTIDAHAGPDLDVLIHVLAGAGTLTAGPERLSMRTGDLLWLPRLSPRQIDAGPDGLRYLTVHRRRSPSLFQVQALARQD